MVLIASNYILLPFKNVPLYKRLSPSGRVHTTIRRLWLDERGSDVQLDTTSWPGDRRVNGNNLNDYRLV